jgi:hypothetical protein
MTSPDDRYWRKVSKVPEGCWIWTGSLNVRTGYPQVKFQGRVRGAHRVAYELAVGPIPEGLEIDHLCRRPACVRPDHLEPVSRAETLARSQSGVGQALRTGCCKRGHKLTPENTRIRRNGSRVCIPCARERNRRLRQTKKVNAT